VLRRRCVFFSLPCPALKSLFDIIYALRRLLYLCGRPFTVNACMWRVMLALLRIFSIQMDCHPFIIDLAVTEAILTEMPGRTILYMYNGNMNNLH
jgi:hypothetical protein